MKNLWEVVNEDGIKTVNIGNRLTFNLTPYIGIFSQLLLGDYGKGFVLPTLGELVLFISSAWNAWKEHEDENAKNVFETSVISYNPLGWNGLVTNTFNWEDDEGYYFLDRPLFSPNTLQLAVGIKL